MDQILQLEIEFIFGVFAMLVTGTIGFILKRLFDVYTKKEIHEILKDRDE